MTLKALLGIALGTAGIVKANNVASTNRNVPIPVLEVTDRQIIVLGPSLIPLTDDLDEITITITNIA